jgi:hypothetical protein
LRRHPQPVSIRYVTEDGEERSITVRADSWRAVLDALETYFADAPDTG